MSKLVSVRRPLVPSEHQLLRDHMDRVNHELHDLQPKWRRLGEAGISLLERGEFGKVVEKRGSKLAQVGPDTVASTLNHSIIPRMPTEHDSVTVAVTGIRLLGSGEYPSIAVQLDGEQLEYERARFAHLMERMSGFNMYWRTFIPHVTVATIDRLNADERVLDAFESILPQTLKFGPAMATAE